MTERAYYRYNDDDDLIGYFAILSQEERDRLPPEYSSEFRCVLEDRESGQTFTTPLFVVFKAYEYTDYVSGEVVTSDRFVLDDYFYPGHHCPCHRDSDARRAGYVGDEKECDELEGKWLILTVTCDGLPGVNLYREEWKPNE